MKFSVSISKKAFQLAVPFLLVTLITPQLIGGMSGPGNGGLQIVFSDDGAAGTAVSASGVGLTDDDESFTDRWLGFSDETPDRDFVDPIPMDIADLEATMGTIVINPPLQLVATGETEGAMSPATLTYDAIVIDGGTVPGSGQNFVFTQDDTTMGVGVGAAGAELSVIQGNSVIPLPFSTFASLYGKSFASEDGFTFVFASPATSQTAVPAAPAIPDLLIGKKASRLKGDGVYNKRKASNKQTLVRTSQVFVTNTAKAALAMQNDGGTAAQMELRSFGDQLPRMKVRARAAGQGNITGDLKRGGYTTTIPAGGSVAISYKLTTNRFFAGVTRNGDRDDTINFRLSGNGSKDNAAMIVRYRDR